jgi:hypothetical protein
MAPIPITYQVPGQIHDGVLAGFGNADSTEWLGKGIEIK